MFVPEAASILPRLQDARSPEDVEQIVQKELRRYDYLSPEVIEFVNELDVASREFLREVFSDLRSRGAGA
jgi:hypothetical protein